MTTAHGIQQRFPATEPVWIDLSNGTAAPAERVNGRWEYKMDETKLRQAVCDAGHQLWQRRMICGDGGFVSAELNRRRFVVTPPNRRRADLRPEHLLCVDMAGLDMVGSDAALPEIVWRPHRMAYQGAAYLESRSDGSGRQIHATALATPPNIMALHTLAPEAAALKIINHPDLLVVDPADDKALQRAIVAGPLMLLRGQGVFAADRSVDACLNLIEMLEHHASIELATSGFRE